MKEPNVTAKKENPLELWELVSKTDPNHTKQANRGGYSVTAIDPYYQLKEATRLWGCYGNRWGLRNLEYNYELSGLSLVVLHAEFFSPVSNFQISNSVQVTKGKAGYPDPDFAKKLETNTLSKALSKLGFSADVFMGQFEDADYLENRKNEANLEQSVNKVEEQAKQEQAYEQEMEKNIKLIGESVSISMLKGIFNSATRKAKFHKDEKMVVRLTRAKDKRKEELEKVIEEGANNDSTV